MHISHAKTSSYACQQVLHGGCVGGVSIAYCGWIEGGATVIGCEAVWDIFVFQFLCLRYPASEMSVAGQVLMVEVTSMTSMRTPVETLDIRSGYVDARVRRALAEWWIEAWLWE